MPRTASSRFASWLYQRRVPPDNLITCVSNTFSGWTLAPTSDGGSDVTYIITTHLGGTIPAWIINAARKRRRQIY